MKNNKGFIGIGLVLAIIAVLVVGGGAYYLGIKNNSVLKMRKRTIINHRKIRIKLQKILK